jgi:PQQ-dependent catabolism-associated CXXCW motif protein
MTRLFLPFAFTLFLCAAGFAQADSPGHVPEPAGLWQGPLHGYTPNTVAGAKVASTAQVEELVASKTPLLIDVADPDKKPEGMPATALWMPAHRSIPGAIWLTAAGSGTSAPAFAEAFQSRIATLTGDDKAKVIITFCHPDCWASWNAAKRLADLGYSAVYWYPKGMEGWQAVHDTVFVKADSIWAASRKAQVER